MRKIIDAQVRIGLKDLSKIKINIPTPDEILQLLRGWQKNNTDKSSFQKIQNLLSEMNPGISKSKMIKNNIM